MRKFALDVRRDATRPEEQDLVIAARHFFVGALDPLSERSFSRARGRRACGTRAPAPIDRSAGKQEVDARRHAAITKGARIKLSPASRSIGDSHPTRSHASPLPPRSAGRVSKRDSGSVVMAINTAPASFHGGSLADPDSLSSAEPAATAYDVNRGSRVD